MSDLKIQGVIEMTSEGAERAFDRIGQKSEQMAQKVTQTSAQAGQAVDQIGTGADRSATEFTRAESRIVSSIKRATTELQNLGKTASQKLELRIDTQGLDRAKFEPYLAKLRELEAAQDGVKRSASGVPSAFDDIARSLGGIAAAVVGAMSIGQFAGKLVAVQREFDILNSSLITVTGSSGAAARELAWIKEFAASTPYALNEVTQAFIRMKSLGLDATEGALNSYANTASAMGRSLDQMIEAVADASTGEFERLKEFGIKAKQQGDQVTLTFRGVATTIGKNADEITEYLRKIGDTDFAGANAERAKTLDGAISNLGDSWDELFRTINQNNAGGLIYDSVKLASGAIADAIDILNAMNRATADNARETGAMAVVQEGIATVFETVAVVGTNVAYVLRAVGTELGGLAAQAAAVASLDFSAAGEIGRMMKEDAEAARAAVDAQSSAILNARSNAAEFRGVVDAARKGTADYATTVGRLIEMQNAGKISAQDFRTAVESMQPAAQKTDKPVVTLTRNLGGTKKAAKEAKDEIAELLAKLQAKEIEEAAKAVDDYNAAWRDYLGGLYDTARGLDEQLELYGLTEAQIAQVTVRRAEERLEMARMSGGVSADYLAALEQEVKLRREIAQSAGQLEARNANAEAAEQAAQDWQRTADAIEDALIDALMEGGKSGKEYIEGLFRSMVLRPIVQAIVQPIAGGITNAMGFGAPGQGSSGGSFGLPPGLGTTGLISSGLQWAGAALGSTALGSFGAGMAMTSSQIAGLSGAGLISGGAATAGATVAAAMPYIGAALFAAQALGLFDKKPSDKTSSATFDLGKNAVTETWDMGGKKAASQEQKDANVALSLLVGSFAKDAGLTGQILTAMGGRDGTRLAIDGGFKTPTGAAAGGVWLGDETAYNYGNGEEAIKRMLDDLVDEGTLPQATIDAWRSIKTDMLGVARDATELVSTLNLLTQGYDTATIERANLLQTEGEALETALARMQSLEAALSGTALPGDALAQSVGAIIRQFDELAQAVPLSVESLGSVIDGLDLTTAEGRKTYQSLMALAPAFIEIQNAQKSLYDQLYTDEQRAANLAVEVGDAFAQLGLTLPTTRDEMRALIDAQDGTTEAGAKLKAQLLGLVPAFVSVSDAAQQAAQVAIDAARDALKKQFDGVESVLKAEIARFGTEMSGLQSALNRAAEAERNRLNAAADAERSAINDQINALSDVGSAYESATDAIRGASSALRNAVDRLRGIERIDRLQYDQAVAQIDVMTVLARAGVMPDQDRLQSAIGTITSADSSRYASSFEMEREQLRRAGQLETLDSIITSNAAYQDAAAERDRAAAEAQMDLLKAQLAAVDAQLEGDLKRLAAMEASGKAQLNALLGVDDSIVSMDAAMRAIGEATAKYEKDHLKLLERDLDAAERYHAQSLSGIAQVVAAGTQQAGLLLSVDYNIKQLTAQMSAIGSAIVAAAQKDEVPAFASGGLHTGGIRLVGERGPELEVTGPARIWSAEDTRRMLSGGADAGTADEIRALRQEQQAQARAQVALEARMVKLLERWERDGMPTTRLELA